MEAARDFSKAGPAAPPIYFSVPQVPKGKSTLKNVAGQMIVFFAFGACLDKMPEVILTQ